MPLALLGVDGLGGDRGGDRIAQPQPLREMLPVLFVEFLCAGGKGRNLFGVDVQIAPFAELVPVFGHVTHEFERPRVAIAVHE